MSNYKAGDKVLVLCEVAMVYNYQAYAYMDVRHHGAVFEAKQSDCRPAEPPASNNDLVALAMQMACERFSASGGTFNGACFSSAFRELAGVTCNLDGHVVATILSGRSDVEVLKGGSHYRFLGFEQKADATCEQAESTPVPSRPVEPEQDGNPVEFKVGDRVVSWSGRQGVVEAINEIEGFPITVRHSMREQVSYKLGGVKHDDHPVEPANSSEIPNSSSDPMAVGDAVRFVSPGHNRHGTEGVLKSIHHGPKNACLFVSDCGQFHRYCTIAELTRADQADPIDIKGSMQSLDGADTIQAGDLQWTDRDSKYRLCNFTIGMRVHEAIQRGKAHGEKWVFYRKFRGAGE